MDPRVSTKSNIFHGEIDTKAAAKRLKNAPVGSFLIRYSTGHPGYYATIKSAEYNPKKESDCVTNLEIPLTPDNLEALNSWNYSALKGYGKPYTVSQYENDNPDVINESTDKKQPRKQVIFDFDRTIFAGQLHNCCHKILHELGMDPRLKEDGFEEWSEDQINAIWEKLKQTSNDGLATAGDAQAWRKTFISLLDSENNCDVAIASFNSFKPILKKYLTEYIFNQPGDEKYLNQIKVEAWLPKDANHADKNRHIDRILMGVPENTPLHKDNEVNDAWRRKHYANVVFIDDSSTNINAFNKFGNVKNSLNVEKGSKKNADDVRNFLSKQQFKLLHGLEFYSKIASLSDKYLETKTGLAKLIPTHKKDFNELIQNIRIKLSFGGNSDASVIESINMLQARFNQQYEKWKKAHSGVGIRGGFFSKEKKSDTSMTSYINYLNKEPEKHQSTRLIGGLLKDFYDNNPRLIENEIKELSKLIPAREISRSLSK